MKSILKAAMVLVLLLYAAVIPAQAQEQASSTPQAAQGGVVTGTIINRSEGGAEIPQSIDVMLHIVDESYVEQGMLHEKSLPDGSFKFVNVPLDTGLLYAAMGVYEGVSYYSDAFPIEGETLLNIDLPIYETTNELTLAEVEQSHVLFNFAQDGLEVKQIFVFSNLGDRTITGTLTLDDNRPATIKFSLPTGANYIFFEPNDPERFVKLSDGFADTAPLVPGERSSQLMVSYLLPSSEQLAYSFTAPVDIKSINFLLPKSAGVTLNGENLGTPQTTPMEDGSEYLIYTLEDLPTGQTVNLTFSGQPKLDGPVKDQAAQSNDLSSSLAIGGGTLGIILVGVGIWWWRKTQLADSEDEELDGEELDLGLDPVILKIAQLDEAYEHGKINEEDYRLQRQELKEKAKALLAE